MKKWEKFKRKWEYFKQKWEYVERGCLLPILCLVVLITIVCTCDCISSMKEFDVKKTPFSVMQDLYEIADEIKITNNTVSLNSVEGYNILMEREGETTIYYIYKDDNSLSLNLGVEPNICVRVELSGEMQKYRNYLFEEDYNKAYNIALFHYCINYIGGKLIIFIYFIIFIFLLYLFVV